jgi:hypothetical protein
MELTSSQSTLRNLTMYPLDPQVDVPRVWSADGDDVLPQPVKAAKITRARRVGTTFIGPAGYLPLKPR